MRGRPLCVALAITVAAIVLFAGHESRGSEKKYQGERKILRCQVEEIAGQGSQKSLTVCDVVEETGEVFCTRMKLYSSGEQSGEANTNLFSELKIGNILSFEGEIYSFQMPGNPGQFNEYQYYQEQNIQYKAFVKSLTVENQAYNHRKQWLYGLRTQLFERIMSLLPEPEGGIVAAMVLGEKSALDKEVKELFQEGGIAHILAISGLHISILGAGLFFLLRRFVMPMRPAAVCTGILLLLYGELTGFSVSAKRAVIMMLCLLAAHFFNRRYDLLNALSLAALIQLWFQPLVLFQAGFLLSYGTVLGIALFLPFFTGAGSRKNLLWSMAGDSLGIFLVNLPVLLYFYYELGLYSTLVNALILPFVGFLLLMSLAGSGLSLVSMMAGRFLFGVVHTILTYYTFVTELVRQLPLAIIITGPPELWQIFLYYILLFIWCCLLGKKEEKERHKKPGKKIWIPILACALLLFRPPVPKQLQITSLDVGQGDCTLIRTETVTILVDGGSSDVGEVGKYRISKFLKHEGIRKLDMIFFTHSDSDHTNGLLELIQEKRHMNFSIGEIILPDIKKQEENYRELEKICLQSGIPLHKMKKGDVVQAGDLRICCLHPYYEYDWQSENDYSLVLQLDYKGFRGLLTGDLEQSGEEAVLEEIENVDYLKVGHHGSKGSSSEEFLKKASPEISVISAGEKNRYGHPAKETLERLKEAGTRWFCTMEDGAVTLCFDGEKMTVSTYK